MALTVAKAKFRTDFTYIPMSQKGVDKPFTVMFNSIPLDRLAVLQDEAIKVSPNGEYSMSINTLNYKVLIESLTGWKNVETEDGPVYFKRDNSGASESSLALIPADIRGELSTIIVEVSKDLPNAENYLKELDKLMEEGAEEIKEEEAEPKPTTTKRAVKK